MRVGIISISHESNTFVSTPTTLAEFQRTGLHVGQKVLEAFGGEGHHEIAGFQQGLTEAGIEVVPLLAAWTTPSGPVTAETLDTLVGMMFEQLDQAGQLDGLLVAPHGAGVSEKHRDMDGHWLSLLRERVGPDMPIMNTLDLHGNVTQRMIDASNVTIAYRRNPHLDQRQRGLELARLMARTLRGEIKPVQFFLPTPVAINIERQYTDTPPCRPMYDLADQLLTQPGVLSNSILLGFPYADVPEMGSSVIGVADGDIDLARQVAQTLYQYIVDHRDEFVGQLIDVDQAIDQAEKSPQPACLLDMGDNVGGGGAADGTYIAHAVHRRGGPKTFVALFDPNSAKQAFEAGVGARLRLSMGGKTDQLHGQPLETEVTVKGLYDGYFTESQPRHGGRKSYNMGPTAIVETDTQLTIQLTTHRTAPFSLGQLLCCQIDPSQFAILAAKGVQAPVAAYSPVCPSIIRVNTPGSTTADMVTLPFHHRRKPLFPFEPIDA